MNINRITGANGIERVRSTSAPKRGTEATRAIERDEMNISATSATKTAASAATVDGVRLDLVNRVRAEIQAGTYYSDEKFAIAFERMLGDL